MRCSDDLEYAVRDTLVLAGAIKDCPIHPEVTIRTGDHDAECRAFEQMSAWSKTDGSMWTPQEVRDAIHNELVLAAHPKCPVCQHVKQQAQFTGCSSVPEWPRRSPVLLPY